MIGTSSLPWTRIVSGYVDLMHMFEVIYNVAVPFTTCAILAAEAVSLSQRSVETRVVGYYSTVL